MLNEFDLKDWDKIDCEAAKHAASDLSDYHDPTGLKYLQEFIEQVELIRRKQVKQIAVLLKPKYCDDFGRCNCLKGSCDK